MVFVRETFFSFFFNSVLRLIYCFFIQITFNNYDECNAILNSGKNLEQLKIIRVNFVSLLYKPNFSITL